MKFRKSICGAASWVFVLPFAFGQAVPSGVPEPATPPARRFLDPGTGVALRVPAGWDLTRKDREVSTFSLDAPTASRTTHLRAVADITFNPLPYSTFSGAYFYLSFAPKSSEQECAFQAHSSVSRAATSETIGTIPYRHGYDEHGGVCTESRDEIYTTWRSGACYRFDLVINNFCGGDVSGVREMTPRELESVRKRLEEILASVQFTR